MSGISPDMLYVFADKNDSRTWSFHLTIEE
nr:MAG TPA_asm: hypothetical protein [Caudoviricetes sp.]